MAIYTNTLLKYLKSTSTWVITILAVVMTFALGGILPSSLLSDKKVILGSDYAVVMIPTIAGLVSSLSIFTSIFSGFKAATMYKDEVEDGTFLVMLSKPVSRRMLISIKWLALQTILLMFAFLVGFVFLITTLIFDKGDDVTGLDVLGMSTLSGKIVPVSLVIMMILYVFMLIFSSVALLVSTKVSVGATIGIATALGIIIPITSLVGSFLKDPQYTSLSSFGYNLSKETSNSLIKSLDKNEDISDPLKTTFTASYDDWYSKSLSEENGIGNISIKDSKISDSYDWGWALDLNFHVSSLAGYATETFVPDISKVTSESGGNAPGTEGRSVYDSSHSFSKNVTVADKKTNYLSRIANILHANTELSILLGTIEAVFETDPNSKNNSTYVQVLALKSSLESGLGGIMNKNDIADLLQKYEIPAITPKKNNLDITDPLELDAYYEIETTYLDPSGQPYKYVVGGKSDPLDPTNTDDINQSERDLYLNLITLIDNENFSIDGTTFEKYVDKNSLLIFYILVALGLVPLSYFLIKKQDFR